MKGTNNNFVLIRGRHLYLAHSIPSLQPALFKWDGMRMQTWEQIETGLKTNKGGDNAEIVDDSWSKMGIAAVPPGSSQAASG